MKSPTTIMAVILFFIFTSHAFGQRHGEPTYAEAEFSFARDPTKVVLHVTVSSQDLKIRTMTIYGDGRLDLEVKTGIDRTLEKYSRQLSFDELDQVVRDAVTHGLAEWDNGSIYARQLSARGGRGFNPPSDSERVVVLISLESYRRGAYAVKDLMRTARIQGPGFSSKAFPNIPEFKGVSNIVNRMHSGLRRAKGDLK